MGHISKEVTGVGRAVVGTTPNTLRLSEMCREDIVVHVGQRVGDLTKRASSVLSNMSPRPCCGFDNASGLLLLLLAALLRLCRTAFVKAAPHSSSGSSIPAGSSTSSSRVPNLD